MIGINEIMIAITILIIVTDLIITGFIGIKKRIIYPEKMFLQLFFLPMGLIGKIIGTIFSKSEGNPDTGKAAIATGMATIMLGALILAFSAALFSEELFNISKDIKNIIVAAIIMGSMIIMLVSIAFMKSEEQE